MSYVLDKSAQIRFEKIISSKKLSKDGEELFLKFYNLSVSEIVPKSVFGEYCRSDYGIFRSIPKNMTASGLVPTLSRNKSSELIEYTFYMEEDAGCEEIDITSVGKVHKPEIEAIVHCLKNGDMTFVTEDNPAKKLCNSLGVKCIDFKEFLKRAGVDKYLNN